MSFCPGGGGGIHNMLRVRVCAPNMGGFSGQNSLNTGPFFGRFVINMGGLSRNWRKITKNGSFCTKIQHKSGYDPRLPASVAGLQVSLAL